MSRSSNNIKRLPRYFRFLRTLLMNGIVKVSSSEIAKALSLTPSQVRSDLSAFNGSGTQGYGYNVKILYTEISRQLGVADGMTALILTKKGESTDYLKRCLDGRGIILKQVICSGENEAEELKSSEADIALITDCENIENVKTALNSSKIKGVWNMTQYDVTLDIPIINLPVGDIIMNLMYSVRNGEGGDENEI